MTVSDGKWTVLNVTSKFSTSENLGKAENVTKTLLPEPKQYRLQRQVNDRCFAFLYTYFEEKVERKKDRCMEEMCQEEIEAMKGQPEKKR